MHVAIIGSGNMAHGIGTRIIAGKHDLTIYDRTLEKAKTLADTLGNGVTGEVLSGDITAEVVIFALPYAAISEVLTQFTSQLAGKILVDISNPVDFTTFELIPPADSSGVEQLAHLLPTGSKLVKAFNTTFAGTLVAGSIDGKPLDVFIAGDDLVAKQVIKQLAEDGGLRGIDVGSLKRARHLEGMQLIHMALQQDLGTNWMSGIKIVS